MTPARSGPSPGQRPTRARSKNAGAIKQALLQAAHELFGQQGFEGTTIRDIGDRAGVDHALISRYYGSKADLYIAALVAEAVGDQPRRDFEVLQDMVESMVTRMDESGLGPVMQALVRSETAGPIRQAAQAHMMRRMVAPVAEGLKQRGVEGSDLHAEIVIAALIGVSLGRTLGWFDHLKAVPREQFVSLITELLSAG